MKAYFVSLAVDVMLETDDRQDAADILQYFVEAINRGDTDRVFECLENLPITLNARQSAPMKGLTATPRLRHQLGGGDRLTDD